MKRVTRSKIMNRNRVFPRYRGAPRWGIAHHPGVLLSPIPTCFTQRALNTTLCTVGSHRPETGAKGFSLKDVMGFDIVEFDRKGSSRASGSVYAPDAAWGDKRREYHLSQPDAKMRLWSGDIHSHPSHYGHPSQKSGKGLGDLGYVEEVFALNEWMQYFLLPIVTQESNGLVLIHPWICERANPVRLLMSDLRVVPTKKFPPRIFNPEWEAQMTHIDVVA